MKKSFFLLLLLLSFLSVKAQLGEWTWMKGDSTTNTAGFYGTQGVAHPLNNPPCVYGPARWTDLQGNFWIFGGIGNPGSYSDLWKFDVATNQWTWMKGPGTTGDPGTYGTMGVPSPANTPGARAFGSASWTDLNGNLWLFGGQGVGLAWGGTLGDLWKYDPVTNEWTWMKGNPNDFSSFGTLQVPANTNTPGMRDECTANWVDTAGNLWLYSSKRNNSSVTGTDMWKYEISSNQWTWMSGTNMNNIPPSYGTQNVFSATNTPGSRMNYCGWSDPAGYFWLFGGSKFAGSSFADLWKYDYSINEWAWASGSDAPYGQGNSGSQCDTSSLFYPSYRMENRCSWIDDNNNLWMFGGAGAGDLNDLWVYIPACDVWSLAGGSAQPNQVGFYGTMGIPAPSNVPGGRMGAVSFTAANGDLWVFGGRAANISSDHNDLWRFTIDPACPPALSCGFLVGIGASNTEVCEKFCIDFFDQSQNNPTAWQWFFPGGTPSSSVIQNPAEICYDVPGIYDVTLVTTSAAGVDTLVVTNYITVYATPPFPAITQSGNTLTCSPADFYQWQLNAVDIPGATNQSYTIAQSGFYTVVVTDLNGCKNSASADVLLTGIQDDFSQAEISIYPNPSTGNFIIEVTNASFTDPVSIEVFNILDQRVFFREEIIAAKNWKTEIDLATQPAGVYLLRLKTDPPVQQKLVISRK